jgi:hypothetical protein
MKGGFEERGDAGIAAVATQPRNDKQFCRSEFPGQARDRPAANDRDKEKTKKGERLFFLSFFSLMKRSKNHPTT